MVLSAILTLSCGLFLFACEEKEEKDLGIYLEVRLDSSVEGIESQTFYMNDENRLVRFEFECAPEGNIRFPARAFREETNELLSMLEYTEGFSDTWTDFNYAGVYTFRQSYEKYGDFVIEVTMLDHRPKIEMEFLSLEPHTVENYEGGKLFTYDYDGQMHFPHIRYFVDGTLYAHISDLEKIINESYFGYGVLVDGEWTWGEEAFKKGERGTYKFQFNIQSSDIFEDGWRDYQPYDKDLYITIK